MIRLEPVGAEAVLLVLADTPDEHLPLRIAQLAEAIRQRLGPQLRELVPGWTTLLLHYDLLLTDPARLAVDLAPLLAHGQSTAPPGEPGRLHRLPICYDGEDLDAVADACGLRPSQVIDLHSAVEYRVGAIGFAPGFAYLGELDGRLALPRRATPRTRVPAGSLAIAERQTAIYPQASPGGWHLLGRCPHRLFDPAQEPPCPLALGDRVCFVPIDAATYRRTCAAP